MKKISAGSQSQLELVLALSFLSRRAVTVQLPAPADGHDVLALLLAVSRGTTCSVSDGVLELVPGPLPGGRVRAATRDTCAALRLLAVLSPFMAAPLHISLEGTTNGPEGSLDMLAAAYNRLLGAFGMPPVALSVRRRGFAPLGGGLAELRTETAKGPCSISLCEAEAFDKICGTVVTAHIGADFTQRMVATVKAEMEPLGHVRIASILNNKNDSGPSPGYECSVYVEGRSGVLFHTAANRDAPEALARECCRGLLMEIDRNGVFNSSMLPTALVFMALARGVSRLRIGAVDAEARRALELVGEFLGAECSLARDGLGYVVRVVGCGYVSPSKSLA